MANSKIVYGNTTLVDLTGDTATIDKVVQGTTFFDASGTQRTGTMTLGGASVSGTNLSIAGKTYTPPSWSTGKAEDIATVLEYHYKGYLNLYDFWNIGDERTVSLSAMGTQYAGDTEHVAQDVVFVLTEKGGKNLTTPVYGNSKCIFQVDQKNLLSEYVNIGQDGNSWITKGRRSWCNDTYRNAIPSDLRAIFKQHINYTGKGAGSSEGVDATNDYFALRSEIELSGNNTLTVAGEGTQVTYYKTASNIIKYTSAPKAQLYFLRSPTKGQGSTYQVEVQANGTFINSGGWIAFASAWVAPFTVI